MKFVVCVKLTPDTEQMAEVRPQDVGGDLGVTMVLNPWDEFAVEEALQLQERFDGEVAVITLGGEEAIEALKRAVAMGIEEAMLLSDDAFDGSDAWGTAHILAQAVRKLGDTGIVLTGKQSVDGNSGVVGPGVAAMLGIPFVSNVAKILDVTEESATVQRALDEGVQTVRVKLPSVLRLLRHVRRRAGSEHHPHRAARVLWRDGDAGGRRARVPAAAATPARDYQSRCQGPCEPDVP